jgi:F-box protein 9
LLIEIIDCVAQNDIADLSRLSQVCKRFAYLTATEDGIWKRLAHGSRFGIGGMRFTFEHDIAKHPTFSKSFSSSFASLSLFASQTHQTTLPITLPLTPSYPTYRSMFRHRPRIRFSGVYISTVNYVRPGANNANSLSWNAPVHVVTYYRYLRFYRDGGCISLLTTTEPAEVVPHLQAENVGSDFVATTTLPVGVMRDARRGRWKMSPPNELAQALGEKSEPDLVQELLEPSPANPKSSSDGKKADVESHVALDNANIEPEGFLNVETEGPNNAYTYHLRFELRSGGHSSGPRNTKLVWRGFWSYNRISDDWGEFALRNDRAFVWSRVRSWKDA